MRKITIYLAAVGLLSLLPAACVREGRLESSATGRDITLILEIPESRIPHTRSMDGAADYRVEEVDILVFSGYRFKYHRKGTVIRNTSDGGVYKAEFKASLQEGNDYYLLIAANAAALVDEVVNGRSSGTPLAEETPLEEVLRKMQFFRSGKWPADVNGSYAPVPMYGELETDITHGETITGIGLARMLARIDVSVSTPAFTLRNVYLCNYNTNGYLAGAWDTAGLLENPSPNTPNLPDSPGKVTGTASALKYEVNGVADYAGEIYTFEAAAAGDADEEGRKNAPCLLLEGSYNGTDYFYRVDFTAAGGGGMASGDYMALLRNHSYQVDITAAEGIGYSSIGEALNSYTVPSNLRTRILSWSTGDIKEFVYNGQYKMGVTLSNVVLGISGYGSSDTENKIGVITDYPQGWSVVKIEDEHLNENPTWLRTEGGFSAVDTKDILTFLLEPNGTGETRSGYVHLQAGRLTLPVRISQEVYQAPEFTYLETIPAGGAIPGNTSTTVTVKARTNDAWSVGSNLGGSASMGPSALGEKELTVTIPPLDNLWDQREVSVWAENQGTDYGETLFTQESYYKFTDVNASPAGRLRGKGTTVTLTLTGQFPDVKIRVTDGATPIGEQDLAAGTTGQVTFTIPNNGTGNILKLRFEHERGDGTWGLVTEIEQDKGNFLLSTGRLVAVVDASDAGTSGSPKMSWAVAMGINDQVYNTELFDSPIYDPTHKTGCGAYWEDSRTDPKSGEFCWRLPTLDEMQEIYDNKTGAGGTFLNSAYWSSTENSASKSYIFHMMRGQSNSATKTTIGANAIRCVRSQ